ncbi:MAG: rRNA pseudouridine synthase [Blastochloris sp.]|nr:rRNA pseudouridine synthase [Blastochloris sp.]
MRLNRYLASAGLGSRRSCEELIQSGRVLVNGKPVSLATVVTPSDHVTVDGQGKKPDKPYTLAMFKPEGVLCSRDAQGRRKTVFDLLPEDAPRLFYVGRLDMDSEGLLILTNRGELAQQLTHPSYKLPKTYHVELDRDFDFALVPRFLKGFLIEPGYAKAEGLYKLSHNRVKVVLTQGLKRQIRLMFLKFGYRVKFLRRLQIGELTLGNMRAGEWRFLDDYEVDHLLLGPSRKEAKGEGGAEDLERVSWEKAPSRPPRRVYTKEGHAPPEKRSEPVKAPVKATSVPRRPNYRDIKKKRVAAGRVYREQSLDKPAGSKGGFKSAGPRRRISQARFPKTAPWEKKESPRGREAAVEGRKPRAGGAGRPVRATRLVRRPGPKGGKRS